MTLFAHLIAYILFEIGGETQLSSIRACTCTWLYTLCLFLSAGINNGIPVKTSDYLDSFGASHVILDLSNST